MSLGNNDALDIALRRFDPLSGLDDQQLHMLAGEVEVQTAAPGTELLALGSNDSRLLFLLEGELRLVAGDGAAHVVGDRDPAAMGPVSRLRPSRYAVSAQTVVHYLMIETHLLDRYVDHLPPHWETIFSPATKREAHSVVEGKLEFGGEVYHGGGVIEWNVTTLNPLASLSYFGN